MLLFYNQIKVPDIVVPLWLQLRRSPGVGWTLIATLTRSICFCAAISGFPHLNPRTKFLELVSIRSKAENIRQETKNVDTTIQNRDIYWLLPSRPRSSMPPGSPCSPRAPPPPWLPSTTASSPRHPSRTKSPLRRRWGRGGRGRRRQKRWGG
jgi:hypothetical protein